MAYRSDNQEKIEYKEFVKLVRDKMFETLDNPTSTKVERQTAMAVLNYYRHV